MATTPSNVDGELLPWSFNFSAKVSLAPTVLSLTASDATAYAALQADFATRLAVVNNPMTRNKATTAAKNTSKAALLAKSRQFAKVIKANPMVTDAQRADLGLPARDPSPTPVPAPASRPLVVVDPFGNVQVRDESAPAHRGKPRGTMGAVLFTTLLAPGATPPATSDDGKFAGVTTRSRFALHLPADAGGKMLWVLAQWINAKGELGPVSAPVFSRIAA